MKSQSRWDSLLRYMAGTYWPLLSWRLTKAQAIAESSLRARAVSSAGAVGLLQLMPAAFSKSVPPEYADRPREDPEANLAAGVRYLHTQFVHLPEIPDPVERLRCALAAYNCGRGYVNAALVLYRARSTPGPPVWTWEEIRPFLAHAQVNGRRCHFDDVWAYVERVMDTFHELAPYWWQRPPIRRAP